MPYRAVYGEKPTLKGAREWGSLCWVTRKTSKIRDCAEEGWWIGFNDSSRGHRIYWPTRQTILVEHDVNFTPAPDPSLLEGEVGEINFNFNLTISFRSRTHLSKQIMKPIQILPKFLIRVIRQLPKLKTSININLENPSPKSLKHQSRILNHMRVFWPPKPLPDDLGTKPTMTPQISLNLVFEARIRMMTNPKIKCFRGSQDERSLP